MADMDLDDLDAPMQAPTRRFAPKNSKLKPKLKTEPVPSEPPSQSQELVFIPPLTTKDELDSKPPSPPPMDSTSTAQMEYEPSHLLSAAVKMEIDAKSEGEGEPEKISIEDQVVRELDVFFTPSIDPNSQLYVLQYPLMPCWRPYELDERCEEVRVKPSSAEIEVELSVDSDSQNYDPDAYRVRMEKQVLSSSWKPPLTTGYCVGVLTGNKLHLNPVHAVVQLRPSLQHLKSEVSRKKNNAISNTEDMIMSETLEEEKPVVPFKKQNKPPVVPNTQTKDIGECWIPLKYHGAKSDFSTRYVRKMVAREGSHIQFSMSPYDYINSLCPDTSNDKIRPKAHSRRLLLTLPLEDRYKTWLLEGPPIHRFHALKHLAPNDSDEDVLGVLQKLAQLVQGLWVPKSSLLYGKDGGMEVLIRNYTLLLFSKNPVIRKEQLPESRTLSKAMEEMLNVLAVRRDSFSDWKFKEPQDTSFIKLHPNVAKEQEQAWDRLEKPINDSVFKVRSRTDMKTSSKPIMVERPETSKKTNKGASKTSNGAPSRTPMSDETREALPKALQKLFQTHKVCSFNQICQRLREMAVSESSRPKGVAREAIAAANGVDAPQEELLAIINQAAINIHGVFVSKSSPDQPQYDGLRKIVIDLLLAEGPNAKLKKAAITEAARMQLKRDITPNEYQKVLSELCVSQGSAWVLKSGDGNPK